MKKHLSLHTLLFLSFLGYCGLLTFSSCQKMPGHSVVPATSGGTGSTASTNGVGPIAPGGTNTVIFQVDGGTKYTWTTPTYVGAFISFLGISTISSANNAATDAFNVTYISTTTGVFDALSLSIVSSTLKLDDEQKEKVNITQVPVSSGGGLGGTFTGTIKGTFDGYMLDTHQTPAVSVRVYGSFNITQ